MSYIVKLCYLPLLTDPTFLFTQPLSISSELVDNGIKANNISFINDEIMVTVDDTLDGTVNSNLFKSNYNCLLLYNDNVNYIEVYKVTSINFISGKQVRVKARLTNYSIDKKEVVDNGTTYLLTNRTELRSKCGFVKYGYAYDSILKPNGTLNLDGVGGTDIYKPIDYNNINILKYFNKLNFRCVYDDGGAPDDVKSLAFNKAFKAWVYIYCEPKTYNIGDTEILVQNLSYGLDGLLPYGIIVAPIISDGYNIKFKISLQSDDYYPANITSFLEENADFVYNVKLSSRPPFIVNSNKIHIDGNNINIEDVSGCFVTKLPTLNTIVTLNTPIEKLETIPLDFEEIKAYYPRGFNGDRLTKQEFENYNYNPYVKGHATKIRITDSFGGVKEYTPFELGLFDGLSFYYYEALTPDITKIYITPNLDRLSFSLLKENIDKTYNGVINDVDLSLPYAKDQLQTFLSNNKNFFQQRMVNAWVNLQSQSEQSANSFISSYFSKSYGGMASAINKQSQALYDFGLNIYNTDITTKNLKSAPDTLTSVKSNFLWLYIIQNNFKPTIEIYTADEYTIKSAYQRFCEFGIKLDKYVDEIELRKYLNFNTVYPHDKTEYKYINCDVKLYGYYTWFLRQQDILERELADGIFLVNKQAEIKDIPQADYDVIQSLKEEDFNFE